jgi:hypothetical protein
MKILLKFQLHAPWHVGTGMGSGLGADALTVKSSRRLPEIPGRSVKGLLRDAFRLAEEAGALESGTTKSYFGSAPGSRSEDISIAARQEMDRYDTTPGNIYVDSARLGAGDAEQSRWQAWAGTEEAAVLVAQMTEILSSTALEDGVARKMALRSVEVALPMALHCEISSESVDETRFLQHLRLALPLLRQVGKTRHRGFGRCSVTIVETEVAS